MKKRSIFVILILIVVLLVSVFMFAACDDKDRGDDDKNDSANSFKFKDGTTAENIFTMAGNGEIYSYMLKSESNNTTDDFVIYYYITNNSRIVNEQRDGHSYWSGEILENNYAYWFNDYDGIQVYKYDLNDYSDANFVKDTLRAHLDMDEEEVVANISNFKIENGVVTWTLDTYNGAVHVELSNVNNQGIVLPDELKNYKELAIEEEN